MRRLLASLLLLPVFAACQPAAPTVDLVAEEEAIIAQIVAYNAGIAAFDEAAAVAVFAPDAVLFPPNQDRLTGGASFEPYFAGLEQLGAQLSVAPLEITIASSGNAATDVGTWTISLPTPDGGTFQDNGKYLAVWEKVDGTWLMKYYIWNSDNAPPAPAAK